MNKNKEKSRIAALEKRKLSLERDLRLLKALLSWQEKTVSHNQSLLDRTESSINQLSESYDQIPEEVRRKEKWSHIYSVISQDPESVYLIRKDITDQKMEANPIQYPFLLKLEEELSKYCDLLTKITLLPHSEREDHVKNLKESSLKEKDLKTFGWNIIIGDDKLSAREKIDLIKRLIQNNLPHHQAADFLLKIIKKGKMPDKKIELIVKAEAANIINTLDGCNDQSISANLQISQEAVHTNAQIAINAIQILIKRGVSPTITIPLLEEIAETGLVLQDSSTTRFSPTNCFSSLLDIQEHQSIREIDMLERTWHLYPRMTYEKTAQYFHQITEKRSAIMNLINETEEKPLLNHPSICARNQATQLANELREIHGMEKIDPRIQWLKRANDEMMPASHRLYAVEKLISSGIPQSSIVHFLLRIIKNEKDISDNPTHRSSAKSKAANMLEKIPGYLSRFLQAHYHIAKSSSLSAWDRINSVEILIKHNVYTSIIRSFLDDISEKGTVWNPSDDNHLGFVVNEKNSLYARAKASTLKESLPEN